MASSPSYRITQIAAFPNSPSSSPQSIVQPSEEELIHHRNVFHTKSRFNDKSCLVAINSHSCTNLASTLLVEKLQIPLIEHPSPYRLRWSNYQGEFIITQQILMPLQIGNYKDEVLCDVVPLTAGHILLGKPWTLVRDATHDRRTNRYSLKCNTRRFILLPMTPVQIDEAQLHIRTEYEKRNDVEDVTSDSPSLPSVPDTQLSPSSPSAPATQLSPSSPSGPDSSLSPCLPSECARKASIAGSNSGVSSVSLDSNPYTPSISVTLSTVNGHQSQPFPENPITQQSERGENEQVTELSFSQASPVVSELEPCTLSFRANPSSSPVPDTQLTPNSPSALTTQLSPSSPSVPDTQFSPSLPSDSQILPSSPSAPDSQFSATCPALCPHRFVLKDPSRHMVFDPGGSLLHPLPGIPI